MTHAPRSQAGWVPGLAAGSLAGVSLGLLVTPLAAFDRPGDWPRGVAGWAAAGLATGAAAVALVASSRLAARALRAVYVESSRPGTRGLDSVLFGLIAFAPATAALIEIHGRPGFQRLRHASLVFAAAVVLAVVFCLAIGRLLVAGRIDGRPRLRLALAGAGALIGIASEVLPLTALPRVHVAGAAVALLVLGVPMLSLEARLPRAVRAAAAIAALVSAASLALLPGVAGPGRALLCDAIVALFPVAEAAHGDRADAAEVARYFGRGRSGSGAILDARVPGRRELNVIWITVCSFRKDRVGALGSGRELTPALDAFASRSAVFERGYTTFPASADSMESMFTGLYPWQLARARGDPVPAGGREPWLPEILLRSGSATWEMTGLKLEMLSADFRRFLDGFEVRNPYGLSAVNAETIVGAFERTLAARAPDRRIFAWIQLMDAHAPYPGDPEAPPQAAEDEARYDACIRRVDRAIGKVIAALERERLFDSSIIIVHGDHGEEFGDHGGRFHYTSLYEEQIGVPLLIRVPGLDPVRVPGPVDLTGLFATVTEVLGLDDAPPGSGNSLVPELLGERSASYACAGVSYAHLASVAKRMITDSDGLKLIVTRRGRHRELYDLAADPGEKVNRAGTGDPREARLLRILDAVGGLPAAPSAAAPAFPDLPTGPEPTLGRERADLADLADGTIRDPRSPDDDVAAAIGSLAQLVDRSRSSLVFGFAKSPSPRVRAAVAEFAAVVGGGDGREAAIALLDDRDSGVRRAAARAVASFRNPADAALLVLAPSAPEAEAVERAQLRCDLGDLSGLRQLVPALPALSPASRTTVLGALARAGDPDARAAMRAAIGVRCADTNVMFTALSALEESDRDLVEGAAARLFLELRGAPDRRAVILDALDAVTERTMPIVLDGLQDSDPGNRMRALRKASRSRDLAWIRKHAAAWQDLRLAGEAPVPAAEREEARGRAAVLLGGVVALEEAAAPRRLVPLPASASLASLAITYPAIAGSFPAMLRGEIRGHSGEAAIVAAYAAADRVLPPSQVARVASSASSAASFEIPLAVAETRPDRVLVGTPDVAGGVRWLPGSITLPR